MIKELLQKGLNYSLANPSEFAKAYKDAFGEAICSYCPGKIEGKFKELLNLTEDKLITMKTRKWKMIPGKLIDTLMSTTGPCGQYTDKNITDEIAEQLIAKGYGKYFVKNPISDIEPIMDSIPTPEIEETLIDFEVFEKRDKEMISEEQHPDHIVTTSEDSNCKKDSFDTFSRKRLVEYCEKKGYDNSEWKDKTRKELIEYVRTK